MHLWIRPLAAAAILPALALAQARPNNGTVSRAEDLQIERLATLEFPWGMAYLPDGRLLITEKPGRLRIYANGRLSGPVGNVPSVSYREGPSEQGGMLDVAVDPDFARNRSIYLSYTEEVSGAAAAPQMPDPSFAS